MKKTLLISGVLLALAASSAMAGGVNLAWTDCLGGGGQTNRNSTCAANTGNNTLVVSYQAHTPVPDLVGNDIRIDLQSGDAVTLNNWWTMYNAGSCRGTSVPTTNVVFGTAMCADFWQGGGAGGIGSYNINGNKASLLMFWAVASPGPIDDVSEWYSINVVINNTKTTGAGNCTGCQVPVCLVANIVALAGDSGSLQKIENPLVANHATWQGGVVAPPGCPAAVPTQTKSWGAVKSLYRQ